MSDPKCMKLKKKGQSNLLHLRALLDLLKSDFCLEPAIWINRMGTPCCDACAERELEDLMKPNSVFMVLLEKQGTERPKTKEELKKKWLRPIQ